MLSIPKQTATVGGHANTRTEKHGDEDVLASDVSNTLNCPRALADTLLGDGASDAFWRTTEHGLNEPRFARMGAIPLAEKIESAKVSIWPRGLEYEPVVFSDANLSRVRLKPLSAGVVQVTILLQLKPEGEQYVELADCLNRDVEVEIECEGFGAQQTLPLSDAA